MIIHYVLYRNYALRSFNVAILELHPGSRDTGRVDRIILTFRYLTKYPPSEEVHVTETLCHPVGSNGLKMFRFSKALLILC